MEPEEAELLLLLLLLLWRVLLRSPWTHTPWCFMVSQARSQETLVLPAAHLLPDILSLPTPRYAPQQLLTTSQHPELLRNPRGYQKASVAFHQKWLLPQSLRSSRVTGGWAGREGSSCPLTIPPAFTGSTPTQANPKWMHHLSKHSMLTLQTNKTSREVSSGPPQRDGSTPKRSGSWHCSPTFKVSSSSLPSSNLITLER